MERTGKKMVLLFKVIVDSCLVKRKISHRVSSDSAEAVTGK